MELWYFETSAVNFLVEGRSILDALATKQLQLNQGRDWRISPVTLFEILMTSNEDRREQLLHFSQHLFSRELLPSPSELIVDYIRQGMPQLEQFHTLQSRSRIADVWRTVTDDKTLSINIDRRDLEARIKLVQRQTKDIHDLIKYGDLVVPANSSFATLDSSLSAMVSRLPFVKSGEPTTPEQRLQYKISLYYILITLCGEAELDNDTVKRFWRSLGVESTRDRAYYVLHHLPTLVHRGPFVMMALMTISQANGKYPRGVWLDSLHSIYITYVQKIFTTDGHFQALRDAIPYSILQRRIYHMGDLTMTSHPIDHFGVYHDH